MSRVLAFLYSLVCYVLFLGTFLYAIGFVGNLFVPKTVDSGPAAGLGWALFINALLLSAFAVQHTIMARPWFKNVWTKIIPKSVERSTFVLFTNAVLILLYWQWRPITTDIWVVENMVGKVALLALFGVGWLIVLLSTFMINHFDLFGLRQTWLPLIGKPVTPPHFQTTRAIQICSAPYHVRVPGRFLGDTAHDFRSLVLRYHDLRLHSGRYLVRGEGPDRRSWRELPSVS